MQNRTVFLALATVLAAAEAPPRMPIPNNYQDSILTKWLAKPVLESKLLDDAESLETWSLVNVDQAKGQMTLTAERKMSGTNALRLRCATVGDTATAGRYYGTASARRVVAGEDWSAWNRLSSWVYPDLPGVPRGLSDRHVPQRGQRARPRQLRQDGRELRHPQESRMEPRRLGDREPAARQGDRRRLRLPHAGPRTRRRDMATFDFDQLELQKVNADHYEGWDVAPGTISFSHSGYQTGSSKIGHRQRPARAQFELVDTRTQRAVLSKKVTAVNSQIGRFQVMDFSEVRDPGTYIVRAGGRSTRPFPIGDDVWKSSLWKAINFFYAERCGYAVPGVHDVCHRDWMLKHGDKQTRGERRMARCRRPLAIAEQHRRGGLRHVQPRGAHASRSRRSRTAQPPS